MLTAKVRDREITKKYLCAVLGRMTPPEGRLEFFLLKDEEKSKGNPLHLKGFSPQVLQTPRVCGKIKAQITAVERLPGLAVAAVHTALSILAV